MRKATMVTALLICLVLRVALAAPFVWMEGESPAKANFQIHPDTRKPTLYSGGKCFFYGAGKGDLAKLPKDGLLLSYDFVSPAAGRYRFWARMGFEWVRAPMEWRLDGGTWRTYKPTELTTNLMELAVWNELAWGDCGLVELSKGKHRLDVRFKEPNRDRMLFGLDALAFAAPEWIPESRLKPGEIYDGPQDRAAAAKVYRVPAGAREDAKRTEVSLDGAWQVARYDDRDMDAAPLAPVKELPADYPFRWMGVHVPGNVWTMRPELPFAHRVVYQTRIDVPADLAGQSFVLHFAGTCYIASVFVNGDLCGTRRSVLVPWDCDITRAVKPGRVNVVRIAVKGAYYTMDLGKQKDGTPVSLHTRRNLPRARLRHARFVDCVNPSSKGEGGGLEVGLVNPVKLVVTGRAYASDVYVRTSVARKHVDAAVEIINTTDAPVTAQVRCEAVHDKTSQVEKTLPTVTVTVPARGRATCDLGDAWAAPKLWWPAEKMGDLPDVYRMRTTVAVGGRTADVREDTFGFREITIRGRDFLLNGVPWRFYNWVDIPGRRSFSDHQEWLRRYHAQNDGFHRFSADHSGFFGCREQAIEYLDRYGIPCRCSTCIDGMSIAQNLMNPQVWVNWEAHIRQVVRAYRNHPAIMQWSIGNEVMLVNAFNTQRRNYVELEKKMAHLLAVARQLDPTRDGYEDGAGDLGGLGPINNVHYSWGWYPDVPRRLYEYVTGQSKHRLSERREAYIWSGKNPFMGGEVWYYAGRPSRIAWFGGPEVYRDTHLADLAAGRYARMGIEGARWQNCAGMAPWTGVLPGGSEKAMARRAVFVREYNQCFRPGAAFRRTIKVFNDSRHPGTLTLRWSLVFADTTAARGEKTFALAPGMNQQGAIEATLPASAARTEGALVLRLYDGDALIFEDRRPVTLMPAAPKVPDQPAEALAVFDPASALGKWLKDAGAAFTRVNGPDDVPAAARTILIGPNALNAANKSAWAAALKKAILRGRTAIVLEQEVPLSGDDLPLPAVKTAVPTRRHVKMSEFAALGGYSGSICHPAALAHPVLADLKPGDFFTWAGGETNYRLSYATPSSGAVSLVQAGSELSLAPMLELPVGDGAYLLSQVLVGTTLAAEPVADRLLANMLRWAARRTAGAHKPRPAAVCRTEDGRLEGFLDTINLDYRPIDSPAAVLAPGGTAPAAINLSVIIVRGTRENVEWLDAHKAELRAFCEKGRWVMIADLQPDALDAFNKLTGVRQRLRHFHTERVRLQRVSDPLMTGVTDRDFNQRGYRMIAPWMQLYRTSAQVFTRVVDASDNIASFAAGVPGKLVDGMTHKDFWMYTQYFSSDLSESVTFRYDRPETFAQMDVWTSGAYYWPARVRLTFDGDAATALAFDLKANDVRQTLAFEPRRARSVTLKVLSLHDLPSTKPLYTIDEIALLREAVEPRKAEALTTPAGIVRYPIGKGGIVLNCLQCDEYAERSDDPRMARSLRGIRADNLSKKRAIMTALLRNMGARLRAAGRAASSLDAPLAP